MYNNKKWFGKGFDEKIDLFYYYLLLFVIFCYIIHNENVVFFYFSLTFVTIIINFKILPKPFAKNNKKGLIII